MQWNVNQIKTIILIHVTGHFQPLKPEMIANQSQSIRIFSQIQNKKNTKTIDLLIHLDYYIIEWKGFSSFGYQKVIFTLVTAAASCTHPCCVINYSWQFGSTVSSQQHLSTLLCHQVRSSKSSALCLFGWRFIYLSWFQESHSLMDEAAL